MLLASSWPSQKAQAREEQLAHYRGRREELYSDLIEESAQLHADALEHNKAEFAKFVRVYAPIGRMNLQSSRKIVEIAESIAAHHFGNVPRTEKNVPRHRRVGEQRSDGFLTCISAKRAAKSCRALIGYFRAACN
jgi:hypothetical protein